MQKKEFKAESKRLLDLMINSIYTHKEIFLRELISNSSDAIDKIYYKALTDENIKFNKEDYYIQIARDEESRTLTISDTGIGMSKAELENNLGVIASSGSYDFKKKNEIKDGYDIIGQFGVGFYSAFMVAAKLTVISKAFGSEEAWKWESDGADGYTIEKCEREKYGTDIILEIKEDTENDDYGQYLNEYRLKDIIKKYSDFIRYPIKMELTHSRPKEGTEGEMENYKEIETVNSMLPIWKKNKSELKDEDYKNFYHEKHFGFDEPIKHIHVKIDGAVSYSAILYIPSETPFNFYTKEYEKGLELYSSGVMIMEKCSELLPDFFSFVKGIVDSEDLSLNISREMLQHTRPLKLIAKKLQEKIKDELLSLQRDNREKYEEFFASFGKQLKYGVYSDFGTNKELLQELLLFVSSKNRELVSLREYLDNMSEDQKYIYYASGATVDRVDKLPQTEILKDKGYEILYLTDEIDEFAIKMMGQYDGKEFKSASDKDLGIDTEKSTEELEKLEADNKNLFEEMKKLLGDKVEEVRLSNKLKTHSVCLSSEGDLSIEMEKILNSMPDGNMIKAKKVLEINAEHQVFEALKVAFKEDKEKLSLYTNLLYNQALLVEGLPLEDPVEFTNNICKLM